MDVISSTQSWVNKVIVKYNICPFAKREVDRGSIRYCQDESTDIEGVLDRLSQEFELLNNQPETETTLLVLSEACSDFDEFLDLVYLSNHLLQMLKYEGVYQLAHFHPDYCFEGDEPDAASNYTNRSPYPTLHIIREAYWAGNIEFGHMHTANIPSDGLTKLLVTSFERLHYMKDYTSALLTSSLAV